ncbi:hypothetical protein LXL04_023288 [Taraxacum kok-saghyz]
MRLLQPEVGDYEKNTIQNFSSWLLDIGNGNLGQLEQTYNKDISWVRIPEQYSIELQQKVIVCPKNETTDLINDYVLSMNSGDITTYIISDEAIPLQNDQGAAEMLMASTFLADLKPKDRNKIIEVKRKSYMDREGNAIQATMSINDIEYFKPIVEVNKAYKISNVFGEETKSKQHTLLNPTTLRFGRATTFHPIPLNGFPSHHFNFISYNQLYSSLEKSPILICTFAFYIVCFGNIVGFTMWDKMAMNFDASSMPKPVMIAVTSCRVHQFQNQLQLSATQATHYYLNPYIEEVNHSLPNQLIAQNPRSYKSVRFTCEGSIVSLSTSDSWYQYTCRKCKKKLMSDTPPFECRDDGLQPEPEIRSRDTQNLKEIPPALEAIKGKRHIFQFHFNQSSKKGIVEFVFDAFLDSPKPDNTNEIDIKRQKSTPIIDE